MRKSNIIQTSCSELLVDTGVYASEEAFRRITELMSKFGWESSPPITLELLKTLKLCEEGEVSDSPPEVCIYDKDGNRVYLEYGHNGYIYTGYRFDSHCNDWDYKCYPLFQKALEEFGGNPIACDGGTTEGYEDWAKGLYPAKEDIEAS